MRVGRFFAASFNKKTPYTFATLKDVNCMVVDSNFSKELKQSIEDAGVKVY